MFLQRSLLLIAIFHITISMSHPTIDRKHRMKRQKRKSLSGKPKKKKTESECIRDFCEKDSAYPTAEIDRLVKENSLPTFYMRQYEVPEERFALHQEHLCQVITRTVTPKRASTGLGSKEYVVQTQTTQQSLYIEACMHEEPKLLDKMGCLPNGYGMLCQQQYRVIPLWVYDEKEKNLKSTQFKVPSGCTVHYTKTNKF